MCWLFTALSKSTSLYAAVMPDAGIRQRDDEDVKSSGILFPAAGGRSTVEAARTIRSSPSSSAPNIGNSSRQVPGVAGRLGKGYPISNGPTIPLTWSGLTLAQKLVACGRHEVTFWNERLYGRERKLPPPT